MQKRRGEKGIIEVDGKMDTEVYRHLVKFHRGMGMTESFVNFLEKVERKGRKRRTKNKKFRKGGF